MQTAEAALDRAATAGAVIALIGVFIVGTGAGALVACKSIGYLVAGARHICESIKK